MSERKDDDYKDKHITSQRAYTKIIKMFSIAQLDCDDLQNKIDNALLNLSEDEIPKDIDSTRKEIETLKSTFNSRQSDLMQHKRWSLMPSLKHFVFDAEDSVKEITYDEISKPLQELTKKVNELLNTIEKKHKETRDPFTRAFDGQSTTTVQNEQTEGYKETKGPKSS